MWQKFRPAPRAIEVAFPASAETQPSAPQSGMPSRPRPSSVRFSSRSFSAVSRRIYSGIRFREIGVLGELPDVDPCRVRPARTRSAKLTASALPAGRASTLGHTHGNGAAPGPCGRAARTRIAPAPASARQVARAVARRGDRPVEPDFLPTPPRDASCPGPCSSTGIGSWAFSEKAGWARSTAPTI